MKSSHCMNMVFIFVLACIFISAYSCFGAVEMTGLDTVPQSPSILNVNDYFSCGTNGNAHLKYSDGTTIDFLPDSHGQVLVNGLRIKEGELWVAYRKKGSKFVINTPTAIIGIRGTDFGLSVKPSELKIILVNGSVEVIPARDEKNAVQMKPGQTLEIRNGVLGIRQSTTSDLDSWKKFTIGAVPKVGKPHQMPKFAEQYPYALLLMKGGTAQVTDPEGSEKTVTNKGSLIKTGSTITTQGSSSAKLSLLCGSIIKLAASSSMVIGKTSLTLRDGACLIRHVGKVSPLKIDGITTVRIEKESVVSVESVADHFVIRVEAGSAYLPKMKRKISAGEYIEATSSEAKKIVVGPAPRSWDEPMSRDTVPKAEISPRATDVEPPPAPASFPKSIASGSDDIVDFQSTLGF